MNRFFDQVEEVQPEPWLRQFLDQTKPFMLVSEKSRSELLVAPILLQIQTARLDRISLLSGVSMDVDKSLGLNGECDFLIVGSAYSEAVIAPILGVVEAKDAALQKAYAQCAAQMYAAQQMNSKPDLPNKTMFGCVTNGMEWQFLKLRDREIVSDEKIYGLNELPTLLGILLNIVDGIYDN